MKAWGFPAGVLLGLLIALGINTFALNVDVGGGSCKYSPKGEGDWWQGSGFTVEDQKTRCGQVGVSGDWWRVAYTKLGTFSLVEDARDGRPGAVDPHWSARGYGEVQGVNLGLLDKKRLGQFSFTLEGGAFLYDSHVQAVAYHWASEVDRYINPRHKRGVAPYARAAAYYEIAPKWSVGLSLERYFGVKFNQWSNGGDETGGGDHIGPATANVTARMITLGYQL